MPRPSFSFLAAILLAVPLPAQSDAARTDALLSHLEGRWTMRGVVQGDSVTYAMDAERVLDRKYVRLHITEVHRPPQYEAHVYAGVDSASARLIVHWIDAFGAGFSIPHGTGEARGDTLVFTFAYANGPFRDTFRYDRASGTWHFLLESGDGRGGWSPFAEYHVTRR